MPKRLTPVHDAAGRLVNLLMEDGPLYPAPDSVERQVAAWLAAPLRFVFADAEHCNLGGVPPHFIDRLAEFPTSLADAPGAGSGILFVFGLGCGAHLLPLAEATGCRSLAVIEPEPEFLLHTERSVDWPGLERLMAARGGHLHLFIGMAPEGFAQALRETLSASEFAPFFVDGSWVFRHTESEVLDRCIGLLPAILQQEGTVKGFVADERIMLANSLANLRSSNLRSPNLRNPNLRNRGASMIGGALLPPSPDIPIFIVGSGPSLDAALPALRRQRQGALLASCGTTLSLLLEAGLTPDLHVEIENTPIVAGLIAELARHHDLAAIRLIASTSVDPRVPPFFAAPILFFRAGAATALLRGPYDLLAGAEPNVANAAFAALCYLGLRQFYLFGIDLGRRPRQGHHARRSVWYGGLADEEARLEREFTLRAAGNFGGEVETTLKLDAARIGLELVAGAVPGVRAFNCSDGVAIAGVIPLAPDAVALPPLPAKPSWDGLPAVDPRQTVDLGPVARECRRFVEVTTRTLRRAATMEEEIALLPQHLAAAWSDAGGLHKARTLLSGSLRSCLLLIAFTAWRLPDSEQRRAFQAHAVTALVPEVAKMAEAIIGTLEASADPRF